MGKKQPVSLARSVKARPTPMRQRTVRREALLSRLAAEAENATAIVFVAPPGYGKSTIMGQWLESRSNQGWHTAWLPLDSLDDEPARFCAMLRNASLGLCRRAGTFESAELREIEAVVDHLLVHDFSHFPAALFIDDFHVIGNADIHRAIGRLAAQAPEGLQVVIGSRTAPPLMLAKARLSGAIVVLSEADLAFDPDETHKLMNNICKRELGPRLCERLRERAGGWAAMLQMAGLALNDCENPVKFVDEFSGTDMEISHYLCEVTLDLQPPEIRQLLLATSPLDLFSPELSSTLTGLEHTQALLAEIEDRHLLLIPLDRHGRWFKYHVLFREFLESRLDMDMPGEKMRILSAASIWFYETGEVELAVEHALRARNYEQAAVFASGHMRELALSRGEHATVQRWINDMPSEIVDRYPSLKIGLAWALAFRQRRRDVNDLLADVETSIRASFAGGKIESVDAERVFATCDMIRGVMATISGQHAAATKFLRAFDRRRAENSALEESGAVVAKAYNALALGQPREARRLAEEADEAISRSRSPYAFGWNTIAKARLALFEGRVNDAIHMLQMVISDSAAEIVPTAFVLEQLSICAAEAYYEANQIENARKAMADAGDSAFGFASVDLAESSARVRARMAMAIGEGNVAVAILEHSIGSAKQANLAGLVDLLGGELATCLIRLGRLREAFAIDEKMGLSKPTPEEFAAFIDSRQLTQARFALCRGDAARATRLGATLLKRSRSTGQVRLEISALCVTAVAHARMGNVAESQRLATQAKLTASQTCLLRSVIDEDYLLSQLMGEPPLRTVKRCVLEGVPAARLSGLSNREGHVLWLISQGMPNRDIAEALALSQETVKWHISNITRKLSARNRTHAVQIVYHANRRDAVGHKGRP